MPNKQTKKIILFIVEGNSDRIALENIMRKIMIKYDKVKFRITSGDITSKNGINLSNIDDEIYYYIEKEVSESHLKFSDIELVVHVVDTDGAFIDDKCVKQNDSYRLMYFVDHIETKNAEEIIRRNEEKAEKLKYLSKKDKIKEIPYICYYMSSNLDHALYNKLNMKLDEKEEKATEFAISFEGREEEFINFLNNEVAIGVPTIYARSWDFIKENTESLKRHSNLNLFFRKYFL